MTGEPDDTVNGRSHSGPGAVHGTRGPVPVRKTRGPGPMRGPCGDGCPGRSRPNAPGHAAHRNSGAMWQGDDPLRRARCRVSCAGLDSETDDGTEVNGPTRYGCGHRRRRSRRGGTVSRLSDRRDGDQHQGARGQDAASGRTGQLGLRYRPGALARIPRRANSTPLSPVEARQWEPGHFWQFRRPCQHTFRTLLGGLAELPRKFFPYGVDRSVVGSYQG
jgi:hypothetical protein